MVTRTITDGSAPRRRPARGRAPRMREALWAAAFLGPALIAILLLRILPGAQAFSLSLYQQLPGSVADPEFVGLENYLTLLVDPDFHQVIGVTLLFTVVINPVQVILALLLASLLARRVAAAGLARIILFLPVAVPIVGSAIVWGAALKPDGPINGLLQLVGLPAQPFLTSSQQALMSIVLICTWIGVGFLMTFLISGLHAIPDEIYEAARLDRSGPIRTFFSITLPLLRRPLLFVLVTATVSNFVVFAPIQMLTKGGPEGSTTTLMYESYRQTFTLGNAPVGAAQVVVLTAIMLAVVWGQFALMRKDVES